MRKIRLLSLIISTFVISYSLSAQDIKRWTLSSTGRLGYYISANNDSLAVQSTFGQCPGCTVLNGGSNFIRQGFQQPLADKPQPIDTTTNNGGGTGLPPCKANDPASNFTLDFSIVEKRNTCGLYYDFEYTGDESPNMKYAWDFSATGVPRYSIEKDPKSIAFTSKGLKFIRLEGGVTCSKSITKTVDVTETAFVAQAIAGAAIKCKGEKTGQITLNVYGGDAPYTYAWSGGLAANKLQTNIAGGTYAFTVTDNKKCQQTGSVVVVEPKDSLRVLASVKDETCKSTKDGVISLLPKGGTAPYAFLWSDNASSAQRNNLSQGTYTVTVTDDNGCIASISAVVKLYCEKTGKDFANTFTPNGDGKNDGWEFPGIDDFPNNTVEIFNRWGMLVFNKKGYKSGEWFGDNNSGEPLPAGPYYYVVNLNDRDKTVFAGAVTIIR